MREPEIVTRLLGRIGHGDENHGRQLYWCPEFERYTYERTCILGDVSHEPAEPGVRPSTDPDYKDAAA